MAEENTFDQQKEKAAPVTSKTIGFPCLQCGNQMSYAPARGKLFCSYCQTEKDIESEETEAAEYVYYPDEEQFDAPRWETEPEQLLCCPSCGAETVMGAAAMTATCPFCSSHYVAEVPPQKDVILPETMIPFRVDEPSARKSFVAWVRKQWLAPRKFKKTTHTLAIKGIYIPYWTFDAALTTDYTGFGGRRRVEHYTVRVNGKTQTRTRTRTDWYPISGRMHLDFDNMPCPATRQIDRALLDGVGPYSVKVLHVYNPAYLAGFFAERYSIGLSDGFATVRQLMERRMAHHIEASLGYDTYRGMHYDHHYENVKFKHILLSLWLAAYTYRDKTYQFLVNGETGKATGRAPLSALKIALLIGAGILVAGALLLLLMALGE